MIIDTFPFNRDFNALEIRFQELKETVDLFIASESAFTHSGLPKALHLSSPNPLKEIMGDQLVILSSTDKPFTRNPRTRELMQRQKISKYLKRLSLHPTDLIIHTDCDEIPRASIIKTLAARSTPVDVILELDNYANYINAKDGVWPRGRVQSFSKFRSVGHMRADIFIERAYAHRRHALPFMRLTDFWSTKRYPFNSLPEFIAPRNLELIENGGWHFNNLFEESEIIKKIESSSHTEWNTKEVRATAISNYRSASDIYTGVKHTIVEVDQTFPLAITSNLSRWKSFIYQ